MNHLSLIVLVIGLVSCSPQSAVKKSTPHTNNQVVTKKISDTTIQEEDWLIIGGHKVNNNEMPPIKYEYFLKTDSEKITNIGVYIDPSNITRTHSLEGIEQLVNLKSLYIYGWELDVVDYSPLKTLQHLEDITFACGDTRKMTKIPDFSDLAIKNNITTINFKNAR